MKGQKPTNDKIFLNLVTREREKGKQIKFNETRAHFEI